GRRHDGDGHRRPWHYHRPRARRARALPALHQGAPADARGAAQRLPGGVRLRRGAQHRLRAPRLHRRLGLRLRHPRARRAAVGGGGKRGGGGLGTAGRRPQVRRGRGQHAHGGACAGGPRGGAGGGGPAAGAGAPAGLQPGRA
ncbi:Protein of unknown function, partial [Gryllus bimaculatus]